MKTHTGVPWKYEIFNCSWSCRQTVLHLLWWLTELKGDKPLYFQQWRKWHSLWFCSQGCCHSHQLNGYQAQGNWSACTPPTHLSQVSTNGNTPLLTSQTIASKVWRCLRWHQSERLPILVSSLYTCQAPPDSWCWAWHSSMYSIQSLAKGTLTDVPTPKG